MTTKTIQIETPDGIQQHIVIEHNNGDLTSMLKSTYDAQQANTVTLEA
jgi:hypothetical protein